MAQGAASALWDNDAWHVMLVRHLQLARDAGALDRLPLLPARWVRIVVWSGDFAAAAALIAEADAVVRGDRERRCAVRRMMLASPAREQAEAAPLIEATIAEAAAGGPGNRGGLRALGGRHPAQRPGPVRRCAGGGPASQPGHLRALHLHVGAARADRGRRPHRGYRHRGRRAGPAGGNAPRPAGPTSAWASRRAAARW